jgi:hypothetical protein
VAAEATVQDKMILLTNENDVQGWWRRVWILQGQKLDEFPTISGFDANKIENYDV